MICRRTRWGVIIAALAVMMFAVSAQAQSVLRRGLPSDPASLDPHKYNTRYEATVILDLFEGTQQIQLLIIARQLLGKTSAELK